MNYREQATAHIDAAAESFNRCDTDGFVSQWSHDISARLCAARAEIQEAGGQAEFIGLYQGDRRVLAKIIETQYGSSWLLHDDETGLISRCGKKFLPVGGGSRVLKQLGLSERWETASAWANTAGGGRGFAGLSSVRIEVYRTGCKWGSDAKLAAE